MNAPLLIRHIHPLHYGAFSSDPTDVLVGADGTIQEVAPGLTAPSPVTELDGNGAFLTEGWVDLHTHIYHGATDLSLLPEQIGLKTGVTTLVDCGSAGEANFEGFRKYIAESANERIFAFLNLGSIGLVACNRISEFALGYRSVDLDRALEVIESNRDLIRGIKVRASQVITGDLGIECVRLAKKLSRIAKLPLVVHVGEPPPLLDDILPLLQSGDVVTHAFNGKIGGNLQEDARTFSLMHEAQQRGVWLDVGHGSASFSFEVAAYALEQGLTPDVISTDLHHHSYPGPVYDLPTTLSKLLALGMPLENVIECVTSTPRKVLSEAAGGDWLVPGKLADFTVFGLESVELEAGDSHGSKLRLRKFVLPQFAVLGTAWRRCESRGFQQMTSGSHPLDAPESRPDMM